MRKKIIFVLLFISFSLCYASIKDMSKDDWSKALGDIGIEASQNLLGKLEGSQKTLDKINKQTKGNLKLENWVEIFKKLNIEPKNGMKTEEWEGLLTKIGIKYKSELPAPEETPREIPAESQEMKEQKIEVEETAEAAAPKTQKKRGKFPKISLDFKGMDIFSTLKIISQKSGMNIIAGSNVRGKVTIYLKDVDALDALRMILEMNSLAYIEEDDVIKVITEQDYEKIYGKKFYDKTIVEIIKLNYAKADNAVKPLTSLKSKVGEIVVDSGSNTLILVDTPERIDLLKKLIQNIDIETQTKVFAINYAQPKDIAEKLKDTVSPNIGSIKIDERSGQLIITDIPDKMAEITTIISSLDRRHQEVLIEAKIVQIILNDDYKMGINWESVFNRPVNNEQVKGTVIGSMGNLTALPPVPLGNTGMQVSVGTLELDPENGFNAVFDFLQTVGNTDLVSSPRIATLENEEAKILVGTKEAYVTSKITNPGTTTTNPIVSEEVQFIDVGIKLSVTPTIGDDNYISMKIRPEVSSVDRTIKTAQGSEIPIVRTSESETNIMVKDGITVLIAGLIEEKEIKKIEGVPLLCKIPIIGMPFRRTTKQKVKTELAVFLTPKIMSGDVTSDNKLLEKKK